ncbi:MAG TPA: hydantoinase/oxoprolinase family protein [Chloroflexota bacterium]|nr:hydantoinase/oxoprolinase family protein [Chloroflexota bacterium]
MTPRHDPTDLARLGGSPAARPYRVGIDIGGTFSDLVIMDEDGRVSTLKVSSAPDEVIAALVDGLGDLQRQAGLAPADAVAVVHGTTAATNAILEYRGARTGLITTNGFRDVLEIRRLRVGRLYDLSWDKPKPLVPRRLRREVPERLDVNGAVVEPLDLAEAEQVVEALLAEDLEAVAVVLVHAYANGDHERQIGELIRERAPGVFLSLSHEALPEIGEYERTSTTVVNAYVGPIADRYLGALESGLADAGVQAPLLMMQSNGGVIRASTARRRPVQVVESGPAGGVVAAVRLAQQCGAPNLITVDMGGTTAKASIVEDGRPFQVAEYEVGAGISVGSRMFKGGGHTLRVPALDIAEVGAGGGSLVRVDTGGGLRVGPESAGAVPGPVCYGLGNEQPTLTDANLVLGYLNQTHLLGGALPIDGGAAHRALREKVAGPLGLDPLAAAYGAHQIAVSNMVRVARAVSTERGRDPRRCVLVAFGGNGPVHAAEVARQLGIGEVIVPPWPGLFSAFGLLAAETRHEISQARRMRLAGLTPADLAAGFESLEKSALATLREEGHPEGRIAIDRFLDLRYRGQSSELRVPVPDLAALEEVGTLAAAFEDEHERTYGYRDGPKRVEVVSFRVVARVAEELPQPLVEPRRSSGSASRSAYFGIEHGTLDTPVLDRGDLDQTPRSGPLIVEEYDATTIVPPGWSAYLDQYANIRLAAEG